MITAETMINYGSYTISRYTYSADVSATGKELTMYEVYNDNIVDLFLDGEINIDNNPQLIDALKN